MGEPLSEFRAGGDIFEPEVYVSSFFCEASRPETVDEDAGAVLFGWLFVDAFEFDHYRALAFWRWRLSAVASVLHGR
jgi:hypothetical protein